jgi:hypothetical protein
MSRKLVCLLAVGLMLVVAGSASAQVGKGKVLIEYWFGGGVDSNLDNLKANANFPDHPASSEWLSNGMDRPDYVNMDYWGARLRAYLTPPETGDYTFWTASDDDSEVWLSTDDTAANATLICSVEGWGGYQDWTGTTGSMGPNFKSQPVTLEAGKQYYIEALVADGTGGGFVTVGWAGPGIGDAPTPIGSAYVTAFIRDPEPLFGAQNPDPPDGAVDWTTPLLKWKAGMFATAHKVYLGTTPELTDADLKMTWPAAMTIHPITQPLVPETTYYWRVDEVEATGVRTGQVWSFTVMPVKATQPSPADGATFIVAEPTLSWKAGQNDPTHDLYLGTDQALVAAGDASVFMGNLAETSFQPGVLERSTTYYWRVDEIDSAGTKFEGDVWSFTTTLPGLGTAKRQIWLNIGGGTAVSDLLNAPTFPCSPDIVDEVPEFRTPADFADNYGGRLSAWLHVPVAGDYTFWVASDDNSQLFFGSHPGKTKAIASVSAWTSDQAFDWYAEQKSATMTLQAGVYFIEALWKEGGGGDNCSAAWEGPGLPQQVIGGGYLEPPSDAWALHPTPADGATGVYFAPTLKWTGSCQALGHDVYFGDKESAVAGATTKSKEYKGQVAAASYTPGDLTLGKTYYWRVDEVGDVNEGVLGTGAVWSFKVSDYSLIDDFEAYEFPTVTPKASIGWWKFDGDAKDSSGKGHDGTVNGAPTFVGGVSGQAIHMDGANDYVVVGSVGVSGTMPRTISGWAKADTTNIVDWTNVFGFTSTPDGGCDLSFDIDKIGGANQYCIHCYCFEVGYVEIDLEWHYLAATYDGKTIKWYHGAKLAGSQDRVLNTQDNVQMGKRGHPAGGNWPGSIDDVRIYNYALSLYEIQSLAGYVPNVVTKNWAGDAITSVALSSTGHASGQSLKVDYNTRVVPCAGAAIRTPPYKDLTRGGANAISVWIKGAPKNYTDWLLVAVMDTNGALFPATYKDMSGLSNGEWANWVVPLQLFSANGVNVKSAAKVGVGALAGRPGTGTFYIDDIRLIMK